MTNETEKQENGTGLGGLINPVVMHGYSCEKVPHTFKTGYSHSDDDDTPYDVGGILYCGRCHIFLDLQDA